MNTDDIIRMAEKAGLFIDKTGDICSDGLPIKDINRFAALVTAAEREACARLCETPTDEIQITDDISELRYMDAQECAAAIRARGNK